MKNLEYWNDGILEQWVSVRVSSYHIIIPPFHDSIIPF